MAIEFNPNDPKLYTTRVSTSPLNMIYIPFMRSSKESLSRLRLINDGRLGRSTSTLPKALAYLNSKWSTFLKSTQLRTLLRVETIDGQIIYISALLFLYGDEFFLLVLPSCSFIGPRGQRTHFHQRLCHLSSIFFRRSASEC